MASAPRSRDELRAFSRKLTSLRAARSVDVTVIYPGVVLTDIRVCGYGPDGKPAGKSGLKEEGAMSVEECARQSIAAIRARERELVMTAKARAGLWLRPIASRLVDRMAAAAVKKG
jgi:short-subunit dehydrogenase